MVSAPSPTRPLYGRLVGPSGESPGMATELYGACRSYRENL